MADALTAAESEAVLAELRERFDTTADGWRKIRLNGAKNMRYVAGDPWEAAERRAREEAGRPCLSLDEINQHTNQVINDIRSNKRGVKFDGDNEDTASFYQDKMREIEYRSHAQIVYTTAAQNAIERGYGFVRLNAKYSDVEGQRFYQELWLEEVVNPDSISPDPDAKRPDSSDMGYCFVAESRKIPEFKREFPHAKTVNFTANLMTLAPAWFKGDTIQIAEYWTVKTRERELLQLQAPGKPLMEVFADDFAKLPDRAAAEKFIINRRPFEDRFVCRYMTNGLELLGKKLEWPGKYIPIASCLGKVIYLDEGNGPERKIMSMVDLMRDPQMIYAYLRTNEAELVGMTPKTPFVGYVGQFRTRADKWARLNHEPQPYVEADPLTEATGAQLLPLPQRPAYDPPIQALEILAESAIRSIRSAAGSTPLPSAAARRSEKSGVALKRIEDIAAMGSYHFKDHYEDMIRHVGVMVEDVMDKFYDTARTVQTRTAKGDVADVRINDPSDPASVSTKGTYQVTVSTGPSFESEQEAGSDLADSLMAIGDPELLRAVLPTAIKLKNQGVIGDELVEIAEALQPPQVQALRAKDGEEPNPAQVQAENAQLKQRVQHAEQAMGELAEEARGKKLEIESKERIADKDNATKMHIADVESRRRAATAIAVAHLTASTKGAALDAHAQEEAMALASAEDEQGREHAHEAFQAELDRQHEVQQAQRATAHDAAMAATSADAASDEAARGRAHESELSQAQLDAQAAAASTEGE